VNPGWVWMLFGGLLLTALLSGLAISELKAWRRTLMFALTETCIACRHPKWAHSFGPLNLTRTAYGDRMGITCACFGVMPGAPCDCNKYEPALVALQLDPNARRRA